MIVKVNNKNQAEYNKLFIKASLYQGCGFELAEGKDNDTAQLEDVIIDTSDKLYISDIYSYFKSLQSLVGKEKATGAPKFVPSDWKYYTMIPLPGDVSNDLEPPIKVNANTRTITVPNELKMFGIVGDNIAEIVFFEIDRFFDTMDFASLENIFIGWRRSNDEEIHKSPAYIKEYSLSSGKLLIGWPITKEITEEPGQIEFALNLEQKEGSYSFSTLSAKATIGNTLVLEAITVDSKVEDFIKSRIEAQRSPGAGEGTVGLPPIITTNIADDENIKVYLVDAVNPTQNYYVDLLQTINTENDEEIPSYTITVQAHSQEGSSGLIYQWECWDDVKQWVKVDNLTGKPIEGPSGASNYTNSCTIQQAGKYRCKIIDNLSYGYNHTSVDSQILYILGPKMPEVKKYNDGREEIGYNSAILNASDTPPTITVLRKNNYSNDAWSDPTGYDELNKTTYTYQWKYKPEFGSGDPQLEYEGEEMNYSPKSEGYYYGGVIAKRNGESKQSIENTIWRVTNKAINPSVNQYVLNDDDGELKYTLGEKITITFQPRDNSTQRYNFDNLEYQWYYYDDNNDAYKPINGATGFILGDYGSDTWLYPTIDFVPSESERYVLYLKATRNGSSTIDEDLVQNFDNWTYAEDMKGYKIPQLGQFVIQNRR